MIQLMFSKESAEKIKHEAIEQDRRKARMLKTKLQEAEERSVSNCQFFLLTLRVLII